jgi:hypothetical protein
VSQRGTAFAHLPAALLEAPLALLRCALPPSSAYAVAAAQARSSGALQPLCGLLSVALCDAR